MNKYFFIGVFFLLACGVFAQQNRGALVVQSGGENEDFRDLKISANGNLLVSAGGRTKDVRVWDIRTGKMIQHYSGMKDLITNAAISPDGKLTAAFEWRSRILVWNNATGDLVTAIEKKGVYALQPEFSADGKYLLCPDDNTAYSVNNWRAVDKVSIPSLDTTIVPKHGFGYTTNIVYVKTGSGTILKEITLPDYLHVDEIYSNSDRSLFVVKETYRREFDAKDLDRVNSRYFYFIQTSTGKTVWKKTFESKELGYTAQSPNKELIASASGDTLYLLSLSLKKVIHAIVLGNKNTIEGRPTYGKAIHTFVFTPNSRQIAVESENEIRMYDCVTGNLLRTLKGNSVRQIAKFSPSGESLIVGGKDGLLRRIDLKNGFNLEVMNNFESGIYNIAVDPVNSVIAVTGGKIFNDNEEKITARLYHFPDGKETGRLPIPPYAYDKLYFTKDGKQLITTTSGSIDFASWEDFKKNNSIKYNDDKFAIKTYDAQTMKQQFVIPGVTERGMTQYTSLLPLPNEKAVIVYRGKVEKFSLETGKATASLPFEKNGVAVTPDGKQILMLKEEFLSGGQYNYYLIFYDLQTYRKRDSVFISHKKPAEFEFSPDGKLFAVSTDGNETLLFDFPSMKKRGEFTGVEGELSFRKDSKMLAVSREKISLINTETNALVASIVLVNEKDFIVALPDNYYMATKGATEGVAFRVGLNGYPFEQFDLKYNRPDIVLQRLGYSSPEVVASIKNLYTSRLHKMGFTESMISADFHLPEAGAAPMFLVREVLQGSVAERMGLKTGDNIIAVNNKSFFNMTDFFAGVKEKGNYRFLVQRGDDISGVELQTNKIENQFGFQFSENKNAIPFTTKSETVTFPVFAKDSVYFLDRINIYVNDVPVYGTQGVSVSGKKLHSYTQPVSLQLSKGKNKIQVSVLNSAGVESLKETFDITREESAAPEKKTTLPALHLIAVGISVYEDVNTDRDWTLSYSAKDAEDIAAMFEKRKGTVYSSVSKTVLTNSAATKEHILSLKDELMNTNVDDDVVLFFSGHGLYDEKTKRYYLSTSDVDFENPSNGGILYEDFEALLDGIPARNKLLLIDACNSGEQDDAVNEQTFAANTGGITVKTKGFARKKAAIKTKGMKTVQRTSSVDSKYLREFVQKMFADLRRGTGATIISSSTGVQSSLESSEWNNGAFTFAVREGIEKRKADKNSDGSVNVSELRDYVFKRVEELTRGAQTPTSRRENLINDFRVW
ncbi:MAG: caspase family protein [Bacteroidetes bacterium]|nr:caspase family protein [Bacteroidota bacterium]